MTFHHNVISTSIIFRATTINTALYVIYAEKDDRFSIFGIKKQCGSKLRRTRNY